MKLSIDPFRVISYVAFVLSVIHLVLQDTQWSMIWASYGMASLAHARIDEGQRNNDKS